MGKALSRSNGGDRYVILQNADINVTPFVDVMLVLLIIFMVSIPPATAALKLDLPVGTPPTSPTQPPVYVSVAADGSIFLAGAVSKPTSREALVADLTAALNTRYPENAADPHRNQVMIRADADLEYGRFTAVLNQLESAGYLNIGLISEEQS
ncbi:MAG: biopolymer transporter ExbD [Proteobacteria bacterium]|nr:biopolymer transporter ExbD [Pseudomonadota bacterium]